MCHICLETTQGRNHSCLVQTKYRGILTAAELACGSCGRHRYKLCLCTGGRERHRQAAKEASEARKALTTPGTKNGLVKVSHTTGPPTSTLSPSTTALRANLDPSSILSFGYGEAGLISTQATIAGVDGDVTVSVIYDGGSQDCFAASWLEQVATDKRQVQFSLDTLNGQSTQAATLVSVRLKLTDGTTEQIPVTCLPNFQEQSSNKLNRLILSCPGHLASKYEVDKYCKTLGRVNVREDEEEVLAANGDTQISLLIGSKHLYLFPVLLTQYRDQAGWLQLMKGPLSEEIVIIGNRVNVEQKVIADTMKNHPPQFQDILSGSPATSVNHRIQISADFINHPESMDPRDTTWIKGHSKVHSSPHHLDPDCKNCSACSKCMITLRGSTQVKKAIVQQYRERVSVVRNGHRRQFDGGSFNGLRKFEKTARQQTICFKTFFPSGSQVVEKPIQFKISEHHSQPDDEHCLGSGSSKPKHSVPFYTYKLCLQV